MSNISGAESLMKLEGGSAGHVEDGRAVGATDAVVKRGTLEEDVPGTWEALTTATGSGGRSQCKGQPEPRPKVARESEDRIRATKSGNGTASGPGGAKAVRVGASFRREPCLTRRR